MSDLFDVPISNFISNLVDESLNKEVLNVSFSLLERGIVPNIYNISSHVSADIKLIKSAFINDESLIEFIIRNIDSNIRGKLINNFYVGEDIVSIFVNKCLPIIIENRDFLSSLYRDDFARNVIIDYLKESYSKLLFDEFKVKSTLKSRIIISSIIEIIYSSLTYNSSLSVSDFNNLSKGIFIAIDNW